MMKKYTHKKLSKQVMISIMESDESVTTLSRQYGCSQGQIHETIALKYQRGAGNPGSATDGCSYYGRDSLSEEEVLGIRYSRMTLEEEARKAGISFELAREIRLGGKKGSLPPLTGMERRTIGRSSRRVSSLAEEYSIGVEDVIQICSVYRNCQRSPSKKVQSHILTKARPFSAEEIGFIVEEDDSYKNICWKYRINLVDLEDLQTGKNGGGLTDIPIAV